MPIGCHFVTPDRLALVRLNYRAERGWRLELLENAYDKLI